MGFLELKEATLPNSYKRVPIIGQSLEELILTQGRAVCVGRWFVACLPELHQVGSSSRKTDLWLSEEWESVVSDEEKDRGASWHERLTLVALIRHLTSNKSVFAISKRKSTWANTKQHSQCWKSSPVQSACRQNNSQDSKTKPKTSPLREKCTYSTLRDADTVSFSLWGTNISSCSCGSTRWLTWPGQTKNIQQHNLLLF